MLIFQRITVMGESAGASSILHHLTSNPADPPAFTSAIIQSAGFFPTPNNTQLDEVYTKFLNMTGAESLKDMDNMDTEMLMQANANLTFMSSYGLFNFGPSIDMNYIQDLPSKVLKRREHHKNIPIMVGHTKFEGLFFTPPWIRTNEQLREHVRTMYPGVQNDVMEMIDEKYPIGKIEFAKEKLLKVADFLDVSDSRFFWRSDANTFDTI
jgi:carboxylesterase type B